MTDAVLRITDVSVVMFGVLKLTWSDGYEGVVDLRAYIADGDIFTPIRDPTSFASVKLAEWGHSIYWGEQDNEDVDFGADQLRRWSEQQEAAVKDLAEAS